MIACKLLPGAERASLGFLTEHASGCYRLNVLLRKRDPSLTAEQHEQDPHSLVRFHVGEIYYNFRPTPQVLR
jgi:hypothetical protein